MGSGTAFTWFSSEAWLSPFLTGTLGMSLEGVRVQITCHLIPALTRLDLPRVLEGRRRRGSGDCGVGWNHSNPSLLPQALGKMVISLRFTFGSCYTGQRTLVASPSISPASSAAGAQLSKPTDSWQRRLHFPAVSAQTCGHVTKFYKGRLKERL